MNKKKIKFSIIIVSLNTKDDFSKTLNSVKKQDYKLFEVIVVDGQSTDGTIKIIKKNKKYINKVIIEKDKGIYYAMNKGLVKIKNKWIIFLNSGDRFYNSKVLSKISKIINKKKMDILVGKNVVDGNFKFLSKYEKFYSNTYMSIFSHQSVFVKSDIFKIKKFNTKYSIASDFDFFKYLYYKKKIFNYVPYIISVSKPGGISDKNRLKTINEFYSISKKYYHGNLLFLRMVFLIYYFKFILKEIIKLFLPHKFKVLLLKLKYRKDLLDD
tara:strand:- start:12 stop:818 length:807 start_codon:yes stop_codon:yes gene_type:complete